MASATWEIIQGPVLDIHLRAQCHSASIPDMLGV
jgi:hypothetical protein